MTKTEMVDIIFYTILDKPGQLFPGDMDILDRLGQSAGHLQLIA